MTGEEREAFMSKKSQLILNIISAVLIAAVLGMLVAGMFTPYFKFTGTDKEGSATLFQYMTVNPANTDSDKAEAIGNVHLHILDETAGAVDNKAGFAFDEESYCAHSAAVTVPVCVLGAVALITFVFIFIALRSDKPSIGILFTGIIGVWAYLSCPALLLGGVIAYISFACCGVLLLLGAVMYLAAFASRLKGSVNLPLNLVCAALALALIILVFPLNADNNTSLLSVRDAGTTAATNPYLLEAKNADFGIIRLASPAIVLIMCVLTLLLSVVFRRSSWTGFVQLAAGAAATYTILTNRVFWHSTVAFEGGLLCALLLLLVGALRFANFVCSKRGTYPTSANIICLLLTVACVALLFAPMWTTKVDKKGDTTVSAFDLFGTLETTKIVDWDGGIAKIAAEKDAFKQKTVNDLIAKKDDLKKLVNYVDESFPDKVAYRAQNEMRNEDKAIAKGSLFNSNWSADIDTADTVDIRSMSKYVLLIIVASAVLITLLILKKDEAWTGFGAVLYGIFGFLVFCLARPFHYSTLYLLYLVLYAVIVLAGLINCYRFVTAYAAERRAFKQNSFDK